MDKYEALQEARRRHKTGERLRAQLALKDMGFDLRHPVRGTVLVQIGDNRYKHYAFRYRVGDGHTICRRGRLETAVWLGSWVFQTAAFADADLKEGKP